jgi:hypothetical protein
MGCFNLFLPVTSQIPVPKVIGHDENDIGLIISKPITTAGAGK